MFTGRRQGRLTSSRAPRMRKKPGVLHSFLPGSIPGVDTSTGVGHVRRCRPHMPPPHLNTISQDVETISILEGGKRDWPANRISVWIGFLQDCRSGLCGWGAVWSPWPGMHLPLISTSGVGRRTACFRPFYSISAACPSPKAVGRPRFL